MEKPEENNEEIILTPSDKGDMKKYLNDPLDNEGTLKKAKEHGSAQRLYKIPDTFQAENVEFCECCNLPLETPGTIELFPYCVDIKELTKCGIGTFLYFFFFKFILLCLLVILGMSVVPTILFSKFNAKQLVEFCETFNSTYSSICNRYSGDGKFNQTEWLYQMSYESLNKTIVLLHSFKSASNNGTYPMKDFDQNIVDYNFINFMTMMALFGVNVLFIMLVYNLKTEADFEEITPSDFTLIISHVVRGFQDIDELKNDILEIDDITPLDVNLTFKLDEYFQNQKELEALKKRYRMMKMSKTDSITSGCLCKTIETKEILKMKKNSRKEKLEAFLKQIDNLSNNQHLFTGVVFASFNKVDEYEIYFNRFPHSYLGSIFKRIHFVFATYICCCLYSNKTKKNLKKATKLRVEKCPEPSDIIWENLEYTPEAKIYRLVYVYLISFILIAVCFVIILGINYLQWRATQNKQNVIVYYLLSMLISCVISAVNYVMTTSMYNLTIVEKVNTMTDFYLSLSIKLSFFTFITSAVVPLVSNVLNYGWDQKDILLNNLIILFLSNAFVSPLYYASNLPYLFKKMQRSSLEKIFKDDQQIPNLTQRDLNTIYENPDLQISYKYSYIVKTFLMSVFYLPLFPLGTVISIVGIWLTYLVEKYNILRTYKRPDMLDAEICLYYINNFKIMIFVYAIGNWIFLSEVFYSNFWGILSICIFGGMFFIPVNRIFKKFLCVGEDEKDVLTQTYMESYFDFATDYERQNPITKKKGNHRYLERLKEEGFITEEMYASLSEKMMSENVNMIELYYRTNANVQMKANRNSSVLNRAKTKHNVAIKGGEFAKGLIKGIKGEELKKENKFSKRKSRAIKNMIISDIPGMEFNANSNFGAFDSNNDVNYVKNYRKSIDREQGINKNNNNKEIPNSYVESKIVNGNNINQNNFDNYNADDQVDQVDLDNNPYANNVNVAYSNQNANVFQGNVNNNMGYGGNVNNILGGGYQSGNVDSNQPNVPFQGNNNFGGPCGDNNQGNIYQNNNEYNPYN